MKFASTKFLAPLILCATPMTGVTGRRMVPPSSSSMGWGLNEERMLLSESDFRQNPSLHGHNNDSSSRIPETEQELDLSKTIDAKSRRVVRDTSMGVNLERLPPMVVPRPPEHLSSSIDPHEDEVQDAFLIESSKGNGTS